MKNYSLLLFLSFFTFQFSTAQNLYEDALSAASYAYSHIKKSHNSNNIFHTQEYADKALESFIKIEELSDQCGCKEANETAYLAKVDLESLLEQDTFERSRFYAKRVKDLGSTVLEQLTNCQVNNGSIEEDVADMDNSEIAEAKEEVLKKEKELNEQRRQLELEQKELEQRIAEQKKMQDEFEARRAAELKEQALIKSRAELALHKLEKALEELSVVFDNGTKFESQQNYVRSDNELKNETLDDTKNYYVNRAKEITRTAMKQLAGSGEN